jgi:hypothetical protein
MSFWEMLPLAVLGVIVVLLPVAVIGLFASSISPKRRSAYVLLYAGAILLLGVMAADIKQVVSDRLVIDLMLLIGGLVVGGYADALLPNRWSFRRFVKTKLR